MRMVGKRIVLRDEPKASDAEDYFRWRNLEEWEYYDEPWTPFGGKVSREEYERRRRKQQRRPRRPSVTSHRWEIDTLGGRHVGWVVYYCLDKEAKRAEIGVALPEEDAWGRGYGTEAVCLLVDHLFQAMGLAEVRAGTWTGNRRMMRVAAKCGFQEVARTPHEARFTVRGEPLVMARFTITRAEWLAKNADPLSWS